MATSRTQALYSVLFLFMKGIYAQNTRQVCREIACPAVFAGFLAERQCKGTCAKWENTWTCLTDKDVAKHGISSLYNSRADLGGFTGIKSLDACKRKCLEVNRKGLQLKSIVYQHPALKCWCFSEAPGDLPPGYKKNNPDKDLQWCVRECREDKCCMDESNDCEARAKLGQCGDELVAKNCKKTCNKCGAGQLFSKNGIKNVNSDPKKASSAGRARVTLGAKAALLMTGAALAGHML